MPRPQYQKIMNAAAQGPLKNIGMRRYRPAMWLDDHVWWALVVEFQSSKHGDGVLLNVAACWLFYPKSYLSYDVGGRVLELVRYENDEQFAHASERITAVAVARAQELRQALIDVAHARALVQGLKGDLWHALHLGVLAGLDGQWDLARTSLEVVRASTSHAKWEAERREFARSLLEHVGVEQPFRQAVAESVERSREMLRLSPIDRTRLVLDMD